jgi:2-amino-4-hydroxy-6-hydroxymethyldihydropteridine diphosphokinase
MKIILLLGGNIGNSLILFKKAISLLEQRGFSLIAKSSIYRSESWGYTSLNKYLNQVLIVESEKDPEDILEKCLAIEKELGRKRKNEVDYIDRSIDIDILYIENLIIENKTLSIPHPRLHLRRFTLVPLNEVLPKFIHPILKEDHETLLLLCQDLAKVEAIE